MPVAVHIAAPEQNLYQLHLTVFGALAACFQAQKRILRRILNLHKPHFCVLFNMERRADKQVLFRFQRFENGDGLPLVSVNIHGFPAVFGIGTVRNFKTLGLPCGGDLLCSQILGLPPDNWRFVDAESVPCAGRELVY